MKDYESQVANTDGTFPSITSRNVTSPGTGDGTPLTDLVIDDIWGFFQAVLNNAGDTPNGLNETFDNSQIFDGIDTWIHGLDDLVRYVDGIAGGTYSPSASLTWNEALIVDASVGAGTNLNGITATGKGNGYGGAFYGGSNGAYGIYGLGSSSAGMGGHGGSFTGGNSTGDAGGYGVKALGGGATVGDNNGGPGIWSEGGAGHGTGHGGAGLQSWGANPGPGAILYGYGNFEWAGEYANQGAIILGGDDDADGLLVCTESGLITLLSIDEPSDHAIKAVTGGAYPATAVFGRSDSGVGLTGVTYTGIACLLGANDTGSPLRIVPRSGAGAVPTTNVAEGCIFYNGNSHVLQYYDGANWQTLAIEP